MPLNSRDFQGKRIQDTYNRVVQWFGPPTNSLYDGRGTKITPETASYALTASYATFQMDNEWSSSWASQSLSSFYASESFSASHAVRSDLADSASWANIAKNLEQTTCTIYTTDQTPNAYQDLNNGTVTFTLSGGSGFWALDWSSSRYYLNTSASSTTFTGLSGYPDPQHYYATIYDLGTLLSTNVDVTVGYGGLPVTRVLKVGDSASYALLAASSSHTVYSETSSYGLRFVTPSIHSTAGSESININSRALTDENENLVLAWDSASGVTASRISGSLYGTASWAISASWSSQSFSSSYADVSKFSWTTEGLRVQYAPADDPTTTGDASAGIAISSVSTGETHPHAIAKINNQLFIGGWDGKYLRVNDPDGNLSDITTASFFVNRDASAVCVAYSASVQQIYFLMGGDFPGTPDSARIIKVDPTTLSQSSFYYPINNGTPGATGFGLPPIVSDGTYLYVSAVDGQFLKIDASSGSLVASSSGFSMGAHASVMDPSNTFFLTTTGGGSIARVNCSDLSFTSAPLGIGSITDDIALIGDYAYPCCEGNLYFVKVHKNTLSASLVYAYMNAFGTFTDGTHLYMGVYSPASEIWVYPHGNVDEGPIKYSVATIPNEIAFTDGGRIYESGWLSGVGYTYWLPFTWVGVQKEPTTNLDVAGDFHAENGNITSTFGANVLRFSSSLSYITSSVFGVSSFFGVRAEKITASFAIRVPVISASVINASGSVASSIGFVGTASWAANAVTTSWASSSLSSSYSDFAMSSSWGQFAPSSSYADFAKSASHANFASASYYSLSASYEINYETSGSWADFAKSSSWGQFAPSSSYADFAKSSSYADFAKSSSYGDFSKSSSYADFAKSSSWGQFAPSSSYADFAKSASWAGFAAAATSTTGTASYATFAQSSSWGQFAPSSSYGDFAKSSSYALNTNLNVTVSYANFAKSSSWGQFAPSSSYADFAKSSSYGDFAKSSSWGQFAPSSSYADFAKSSSYADFAKSSSYADFAKSSSWTGEAVSSSYVLTVDGGVRIESNSVGISGSLVTPFYGYDSGLKIGTMEIQSKDNNNGWICNNAYSNDSGTSWVRRLNGPAGVIHFSSPEMDIRMATSDVAGTTLPTLAQLKIEGTTDSVYLGGAFNPNTFTPVGWIMAITGSGRVVVSGSVAVRDGITGSLMGTSSYADFAKSASWAPSAATASWAVNAQTASVLQGTASYADFAKSSSWGQFAPSSSHAEWATTASYALNTGTGPGATGVTQSWFDMDVKSMVMADSGGYTGQVQETSIVYKYAQPALLNFYYLKFPSRDGGGVADHGYGTHVFKVPFNYSGALTHSFSYIDTGDQTLGGNGELTGSTKANTAYWEVRLYAITSSNSPKANIWENVSLVETKVITQSLTNGDPVSSGSVWSTSSYFNDAGNKITNNTTLIMNLIRVSTTDVGSGGDGTDYSASLGLISSQYRWISS